LTEMKKPSPVFVVSSWRERVATAVRVQGMTREERAAAMPMSAEIVRAFAAEFSVVEVRATENNLFYEWIKK
jgi:ribosome-binding protein aMBF1 (putative translation factor)